MVLRRWSVRRGIPTLERGNDQDAGASDMAFPRWSVGTIKLLRSDKSLAVLLIYR
jgi:hypothetical protein